MSQRLTNSLVSIGLVSAIALSWLGTLDNAAKSHTDAALKRALITYAVTRSLNGVISVAQGTEIALQPAGIGVTLSAGEILDPLNDLVERFSWLTLMAATSLGVQSLMTEIFGHQSANLLLTLLLVVLAVLVWIRNRPKLRSRGLRLAIVLIIVRFSFALVALLSSLFSETFLLQKEQQSMDYLSQTETMIESTQIHSSYPAAEPEISLLERFNSFIEEQREALDIQARLDNLKAHSESAVDHVINLMVVFLIETILLPLGVFYLVVRAIKLSWSYLAD